MRKVAIITGLYAAITFGWLLSSCESNENAQKEEFVAEQGEATKSTLGADTTLETTDGMADSTALSENLEVTAEDLASVKQEYVNTMQNSRQKLNERIDELDRQLTDPTQANQPQWVEEKKKLVGERNRLSAMMLNLQKPMTDKKWVIAEEEIKSLLASIDEQLKEKQ